MLGDGVHCGSGGGEVERAGGRECGAGGEVRGVR